MLSAPTDPLPLAMFGEHRRKTRYQHGEVLGWSGLSAAAIATGVVCNLWEHVWVPRTILQSTR
jgi:hypothetical protein